MTRSGGNFRYDGDRSEARDMAQLGDVCPAEQLAAHPWLAELHSLTTSAAEKIMTATEKTEDYVVHNPNLATTEALGTAFVVGSVLPKAIAVSTTNLLPEVMIGGIGLGFADIAVSRVTGKMLGCYRPPYDY